MLRHNSEWPLKASFPGKMLQKRAFWDQCNGSQEGPMHVLTPQGAQNSPKYIFLASCIHSWLLTSEIHSIHCAFVFCGFLPTCARQHGPNPKINMSIEFSVQGFPKRSLIVFFVRSSVSLPVSAAGSSKEPTGALRLRLQVGRGRSATQLGHHAAHTHYER